LPFAYWYSERPLEDVLSITTSSIAHCDKYKSRDGPVHRSSTEVLGGEP
jgi:hypothetical protein